MSRTSRVLLVLAVLILVAAYFFPLWIFVFEAPQYPEGLGMQIWINKVTGSLSSINDLNHYIGMMTIQPDSFAELRTFPWILAAIGLFGLITAAVNRLGILIAWVCVFGAFAIDGLIDFHHWLHHFGHDLDPHAAIQIEPFTPPMLGSNTIVNFIITAYPGVGGIVMMLSFVLGAIALMIALRQRGQPNTA